MGTGGAAPLPEMEDTAAPDTLIADAATPDAAIPDAAIPDAAMPGAAAAGADGTGPATVSRAEAAPDRPEAFRTGSIRLRGTNVRGTTDRMTRCLATLGLRPGASLDEINTTYYTILKRFPERPTEDDEAHMRDLRRAYEVLRRGYVPPRKKSAGFHLDKRFAMPLLGVATVALAGVLLYLNWGTVRLKITYYEPGVVLRLKTAAVPYGTIVGYNAQHRFPAGRPGAAYEVRLEGKSETVWVSERLIVNGMVPVGK